jgi:hypothetical protein
VTTPRSDFDHAQRDRRDRPSQPIEPPIVTPPIP